MAKKEEMKNEMNILIVVKVEKRDSSLLFRSKHHLHSQENAQDQKEEEISKKACSRPFG
ncbi:hypothetical protein [Candidatus Coxiella mudrowiae]|uniref:hypothetical protein n=1 Tax=Candidatus Coxiella mudrowiae TaxID=2054173 RepID=UPI0012FF5822|nr:hypothetical protein [Candidatus Coxiella mudrowiae]